MRLSCCPECGAEYPDYYSPEGTLGVLCDACGYHFDIDEHPPIDAFDAAVRDFVAAFNRYHQPQGDTK